MANWGPMGIGGIAPTIPTTIKQSSGEPKWGPTSSAIIPTTIKPTPPSIKPSISDFEKIGLFKSPMPESKSVKEKIKQFLGYKPEEKIFEPRAEFARTGRLAKEWGKALVEAPVELGKGIFETAKGFAGWTAEVPVSFALSTAKVFGSKKDTIKVPVIGELRSLEKQHSDWDKAAKDPMTSKILKTFGFTPTPAMLDGMVALGFGAENVLKVLTFASWVKSGAEVVSSTTKMLATRNNALDLSYKILKVNKKATDREIELAFRDLTQKYHPDKPGGDVEKFKAILNARNFLLKNKGVSASDILKSQAEMRPENVAKATKPLAQIPAKISTEISKPLIVPPPSVMPSLVRPDVTPEIPIVVPTKPPITPLAQEARKYKSAEEFVKAIKGYEKEGGIEPILYHGSVNKWTKLKDKPLFLAEDSLSAKTYGENVKGFIAKEGKNLNMEDTPTAKKVLAEIFGSPEKKKLFDTIPENYLLKGEYERHPKLDFNSFDDWLWEKYPGMEQKAIRAKLQDAYVAYGTPSKEIIYNKWDEIIKYAKSKNYDYIKHTGEDIGKNYTFPETVVLNPKKTLTEVTQSQLTKIFEEAQAVKGAKEVKPTIPEVQPTLPTIIKDEPRLLRDKLYQAREDINALNEMIKEHPAFPLTKYANKNQEIPEVVGLAGGKFRRFGDDIANELGFVNSEAARDSYQNLVRLRERRSRLELKIKEIKDNLFAIEGIVPVEKGILGRRRDFIRAVQKQFGLSDTDLKSITKRDIRLMNNFEFKKFLDDIRIKAEKFGEKKQAMNELIQQIQDKELDVENLRKAMKLPTMKNMTIDDIRKLDESLEPFQKGDEFLSLRKLETVDRTELKGIKTWREARERLAQRLGVSVEKLQNIKVSEYDRFRFDTSLAERNDFYKMMVEETAARMLTSEAEYLTLENETFALARKLKPKGIIARLIPQQKIIREFMEAPIDKKQAVAEKMTQAELDLAGYMTKKLSEARDYLIQTEAMKMGKENYFTHIRRGILEAVKEDGIIQASKEVFIKYKQEEQNFEILDKITGEVLALDKFFKFAMHRTGGLIPTENVVNAFLIYQKMLLKKQALDEIVPLIDIYAHSLTPKEATKSGILLHGNLIKFVKEWLNTKKGRHITLIAKQGGKIDRGIRAGIMFTSLRDLAFNLPVSIATEIGEQVTTYQLLGKRKYILGKIRQNTKQGKIIIERYRNFIGKNPWKELIEPARGIGERLTEGIFVLFRDASVRSNKTFLLGTLSKEEFTFGIISSNRLASLKTELGRYRQVEGTASIIGATPEGRQYSQYKKWAIPILRTTAKNLANISIRLKSKTTSRQAKLKSALELYRLIEFTAFVLIVKALIGGEDDDSFVGKLKSKAYREATTLIQALNPKMFLATGRLAAFIEEFGSNLYLLLMLEQYKTTGEMKGIKKIKRQFTPVGVSQFKTKEKKTKSLKMR